VYMSDRYAPSDAYVEPLTVRSYEVTRSGAPQPGALLRYLEFLATRASASVGFPNDWYAAQGSAWLVRDMTLLLGWLPPMDSEILMATWVAEFRRVQALREYAIWHPASGRIVVRARARWAYVQRHTGHPLRVPDEMIARFTAPQSAMSLPVMPAQTSHPPLWSGSQTLVAREYEADVHQHINNCVYGDWLYEGVGATLRAHGHDATELRPRLLALEYLRQARPGDQVRIQTDLHRDGTRRFRAEQTLRDVTTGALILRGRTRYLATKHLA
jgi:acyl-CoA thioester hydrolase